MRAVVRRRLASWAWAAPVCLAGLVIPLFWPFVLISAVATSRTTKRLSTALPAVPVWILRACEGIESLPVRSFLLSVALFALSASWVYSHVAPRQFGSCHDVALYFGPHPSVRDCDPYGTSDFAVPFGVILALFVITGDGDVSFTIPGVGRFERTRQAKEAAKSLREDPDLDARLAIFSAYLEALDAPNDAPNAER